MDPITAAVTRFQDDFREFREDPRARILRVIVAQKNIGTLVKALRGEEWQPENQSPFLVFETAYQKEPAPFAGMSHVVREHYSIMKTAMEEQGTNLPDLMIDAGTPVDDLTGFAVHVRRFAECTGEKLDPPMVCWLPTLVEDYKEWTNAVVRFMSLPFDKGLRFVIGDQDGNHLAAPLGSLGDAVTTIRFDIDEAGLGDYFKQMMAPPSAGRARGTLPGAAAPDVEPPPRPGKPPPTDEEIKAAVAKAGLPPVLTESQGEELRRLIFEAAEAGSKNDGETTIKKQRAACELCADAGVKLEQALMTLVLATYLIQFKMEDHAAAQYRQSVSLSEDIEAWPQVSQARMGLAYLLLKNGIVDEAAAEYERAADAAEKGEANLLYIETQRMAGTCHMQRGRRQDAARCWQAAVDQGKDSSPDEIKVSSFLEVAQNLIALLRENGLEQQAQSVEAVVTEIGEATNA